MSSNNKMTDTDFLVPFWNVKRLGVKGVDVIPYIVIGRWLSSRLPRPVSWTLLLGLKDTVRTPSGRWWSTLFADDTGGGWSTEWGLRGSRRTFRRS